MPGDVMPYALSAGADGSVLVAGTFGTGSRGVGVVAILADGRSRRIWSADRVILGMSVADDGSVRLLTVRYQGDRGEQLVLALEPDGRERWRNALGDLGDEFNPRAIAVAPNGDTFVVGNADGHVPRDSEPTGPPVATIARLGADGAFLWSTRLGKGELWMPTAVAALPDGGALVAGHSMLREGADVARVDAEGTEVWTTAVAGRDRKLSDIAVSEHAGVIAVGDVGFEGLVMKMNDPDVEAKEVDTGVNGLVVRLDLDGRIRWEKTIEGDHLRLNAISLHGAHAHVVGMADPREAVLLELDGNGDVTSRTSEPLPTSRSLRTAVVGTRAVSATYTDGQTVLRWLR